MKILKTDVGVGFPIRLDDFRYMVEGLTDPLAALCEGIGALPDPGHGLLLSGTFSVVEATATISDAWIYFDGEVYFIASQSLKAVNTAYPAWYFEVEEVEGTYRIFKDSVSRPVHVDRRLRLETYVGLDEPPGGSLRHTNLVKLEDVLVFKTATSWQSPTLGSGSVNISGNSIRYRRNSLNNLEIMGKFKTSSSASATLFTLITGFRPSREQTITIFAETLMYQLAEKPMNITITPSGLVSMSNYGDVGEGEYSFCNTIFL